MKLDRTALALSSIAFAVLVSTPRPVQAGELKGRLFVGDKPAAGVTLAALPAETAFEAAQREAKRAADPKPLATAVSNSDGTFTLKVPVDPAKPERAFEIQTSGGGTVGITLDGVWDTSETEELADVTLVKGASVTGRVVNGEGQPVAGADVVLEPGSGRGGILALGAGNRTPRKVTTREDGTFRFEDGAEQGNRLSISKEGFATHQAVNVRSGALGKPIVLTPPVVVTGTVLLPTKKPAAAALVRFEGKATTRWVETNAEGVFRIADAGAGRGTLVADAGEAGTASLAQASAPPGEGKSYAL
ncbi:MAG: carboxypeptidase regulatory-like domain-containing protein, partial [Acidobacteria bacterium]|nr:carboxypeptidase regulatory-like domain-containing protein [Acidobacteriota bacterium]